MYTVPVIILSVLPIVWGQFSTPQQPIPVTVYYESLCPDSANFITSQLFPAFTSSIRPRFAVSLIPYGKSTRETKNGAVEFECHHGPNECYGNKVQACAIKHVSDQAHLMGLVNCLMTYALQDKNAAYPIEKCATTVGIQFDDIVTCANGTEGTQLLEKAGELTDALKPALQSVPTVVANNIHTDEAQKKAVANFRGLICSMLEGDKPADCSENGVGAIVPSIAVVLGFLSQVMLW